MYRGCLYMWTALWCTPGISNDQTLSPSSLSLSHSFDLYNTSYIQYKPAYQALFSSLWMHLPSLQYRNSTLIGKKKRNFFLSLTWLYVLAYSQWTIDQNITCQTRRGRKKNWHRFFVLYRSITRKCTCTIL